MIATAYVHAALTYNAAGKSARAREWAKLALEARLVTDGKEHADVDAMREMVEGDLTRHWSFGSRIEKH